MKPFLEMFVLTRREQLTVLLLALVVFAGAVLKRHLDHRAETRTRATTELH